LESILQGEAKLQPAIILLDNFQSYSLSHLILSFGAGPFSFSGKRLGESLGSRAKITTLSTNHITLRTSFTLFVTTFRKELHSLPEQVFELSTVALPFLAEA
jgi:hypothetical protein